MASQTNNIVFRPPSKSRSTNNLMNTNVNWQCVFCGRDFHSEVEKDRHSSSCIIKESIHSDKILSKTVPSSHAARFPERHPVSFNNPGQMSGDKMTGQSYHRSQSLDTSLQMQRVVLIWKKQHMTIETEIVYFDNQDGVVQLKWDKNRNYFTNATELTPGNHSGCLTLSDSDYDGNIAPFYVLEKSDVVQEFTLLLCNPPRQNLYDVKAVNVSSTKDDGTLKSLKSKLKESEARAKEFEHKYEKVAKEIETRAKEFEHKYEKVAKEIEKLEREKDKSKHGDGKYKSELDRLTLTVQGLEMEKSEAQRALSAIAADKNEVVIENGTLKAELNKLREQLDIGKIDFRNKLTESGEKKFWNHLNEIDSSKKENDATKIYGKETIGDSLYINMDTATKLTELNKEIIELKKRCEEKDREATEARIKSDEIIDYLHSERQRLESELKLTIEELENLNKSKKIAEETHKNVLPIPPRSTPAPLSHPDTNPLALASNVPPTSQQESFFISYRGNQIPVLPLSYFNPKELERSVVYCAPTAESSQHISAVLQCSFLDKELSRSVSGVSFFREAGSCDGVYNGVRYFQTEPNKAAFLASDLVLVPLPTNVTHKYS